MPKQGKMPKETKTQDTHYFVEVWDQRAETWVRYSAPCLYSFEARGEFERVWRDRVTPKSRLVGVTTIKEVFAVSNEEE